MSTSENRAESVLKGLDLESRQMVLDTIGQLKNRLLTKEKILEFDKQEVFPEKIIREMLGPDVGLQLIFIPESYGGMGGGARDLCAVTREMAKICLGVGTAFFAIQLGADPILVGGTEEQKEKWIGAIAQGNSLVAYAVTEPDAGSNLAAIKTKADPVYNESKDIVGYNINGTKQFISTGGYADFITLLANTPQGPSFFIVEKNSKGFVQGKGEEKHGIRASNTSPLSFSDVFVPVGNLIGAVPGKGMKQANKVFGETRLMVAAMALGAGEAAVEIAVDYAGERIQFGAPISEKQGYTHKLIVPHAVRLEAAAAYLDETCLRADLGEDDLEVEGAIAKYFTTEAANKAADDAMQALGGYGYINEYEVEKIKRDVKITCIYEGTSEIQQNIISTFRWKKTRKTKGGFYRAIADEMKNIDALMPEGGCGVYGRCAEVLNEMVMLVNDHKLTKKQYVMFMLADMMTYVEVGAGIARKAASLVRVQDSEAVRIRLAAKLFADETARLTVQNSYKILLGAGVFDRTTIGDQLERLSYHELMNSCYQIISDMDRFADILFQREPARPSV